MHGGNKVTAYTSPVPLGALPPSGGKWRPNSRLRKLFCSVMIRSNVAFNLPHFLFFPPISFPFPLLPFLSFPILSFPDIVGIFEPLLCVSHLVFMASWWSIQVVRAIILWKYWGCNCVIDKNINRGPIVISCYSGRFPYAIATDGVEIRYRLYARRNARRIIFRHRDA